jgi:flavin reductase (DIM6/NTAB) family NADH-FMN oxidoreductase RutF
MTRRFLEDTDALRMLGGGPVALVSTRWRDQTDVMPAIWHTPLSRTPPLVGVVVHPSRHTHDMIRFSEEFALNFPTRELMNHAQYFGTVSGSDVGKLDLAKLDTFRAAKIHSPLIESCLAWIECALHDTFQIGDHTLFIGRVLVVQANEDAFDQTWTLDSAEAKPLHYLGLDRYATLGNRLQARLRTTDEGTIELAETKEEREQREEAEALEEERLRREGMSPNGEKP